MPDTAAPSGFGGTRPRSTPAPARPTFDLPTRHTVSRRVYDLILANLESGLIDFNDILDEGKLAAGFDASRNAVREALQQLAAEGILERARRVGTRVRGTFALIPTDDAADAAGRVAIIMDVVDSAIVPVPETVRARLRLPDEVTDVRMVENLFRRGNEIIGIRSAYYSVEYTSVQYPRLATMRSALSEYFGREVGEVDTVIGSTAADARTARLLGIAYGSPMLHRRQVYYDRASVPIQVTFDHYRSDRVLFNTSA